MLNLLECALQVSEYTDNVDVSGDMLGWRMWYSFGGNSKKEDTMRKELKEMLSLCSGLFVANNFNVGQQLVKGTQFKGNEAFFQKVFELGRRYKITNPDKMRETYGKLMHLLQDAVAPGLLNFNCKRDIITVTEYLSEKNCLDLLKDSELLLKACRVLEDGMTKLAAEKAKARLTLVEKYKIKLTEDDLLLILDSISDANSYLVSNRNPVDRIIYYLSHYFDPNNEGDKESGSLQIKFGKGGSKLSHSHSTQYTFVMQSLMLWREIQHEMFKLWLLADEDLLNEDNSYRLYNTGQGLNRMQSAPKISQAMHSILHRVQTRVQGWVGLSVVHLGDRDVPNALFFIDKYTQVPRILAPIVKCIENLASVAERQKGLADFLTKNYGGVEGARKLILQDFFRHGFDGSGDDGGSCVDGRLTSAWNWCSKLEKKNYHPLFLLTGFEGFDGKWK